MGPVIGLDCFKRALLALRLQPLALTGVSVFAALGTILATSIPFVGTLLASLWMPFGAALTGIATRDALAGRAPSYQPLIAALKSPQDRRELITTGLLYAVASEILTWVFTFFAKDEITNWKMLDGDIGLDTATVFANIPYDAIAATALLYIPVLMMTAFSPLLIVVGGQTAGKSFFYSFFGTLRNFATVLTAVVLLIAVFGGGFAAVDLLFISIGIGDFFLFLSPILMAITLAVSNALVWTLYEKVLSREMHKG